MPGTASIHLGTLRFALTFVALFALLAGGFEVSRGTVVERIAVHDLILVPTVKLLDVLTPAHPVRLVGRSLLSEGAQLRVTRGCEGIELMWLLLAAVIASPASLVDKLRGIVLGGLLAYALSVARLTMLDFTLRDAPRAWQAMHGLIMPLVPIIVLATYFLYWSAAHASAPASRAASGVARRQAAHDPAA